VGVQGVARNDFCLEILVIKGVSGKRAIIRFFSNVHSSAPCGDFHKLFAPKCSQGMGQ
jgi:hypothetical protein